MRKENKKYGSDTGSREQDRETEESLRRQSWSQPREQQVLEQED